MATRNKPPEPRFTVQQKRVLKALEASPQMRHVRSLLDRPLPLATSWIWILSGGGAKGSFEVGVLNYLRRHYSRYRPSAVVGTSVGAVNSVLLATGNQEDIAHLTDIWLGLRRRTDMYDLNEGLRRLSKNRLVEAFGFDPEEVFLEPEDVSYDFASRQDTRKRRRRRIKRFFKKFGIGLGILSGFSTPLVSHGLVLAAYLKIKNASDDLEDELENLQSLLSLGPISRLLQEHLTDDVLSRLRVKLRLVSVAIETGGVCYVDEKGRLAEVLDGKKTFLSSAILQGAQLRTMLANGVLASAAIPVTFPAVPVRVGGRVIRTLVDGGVRDVLPARTAIDVMEETIKEDVLRGKTGLIAIFAGRLTLDDPSTTRLYEDRLDESPPGSGQKNLLEIGNRSLDILSYEVKNQDFDPIEALPESVARVIIAPHFNIHDGLEIDPGLIRIAIAYGYMSAFDAFEGEQFRGRANDLARTASAFMISLIRRYAWQLERRFDVLRDRERREFVERHRRAWGGAFEPSNPILVWRPGVLPKIRNAKTQVAQWVKFRMANLGDDSVLQSLREPGSDLRGGVNEWWDRFEEHTTEQSPIAVRFSTPWIAHVDGDGRVLPEASPPS